MPHQCTNCGRTFADGSKEMLSGCPDCAGTKFQFSPDGFDGDTAGTPPDPPDRPGDGVSRAVGDAAATVRDLVTGSAGPDATRAAPPDGTAGSDPENDIIVAESDAAEDAAQTDARTEVADPDDLPESGDFDPSGGTDSPSAPDADRDAGARAAVDDRTGTIGADAGDEPAAPDRPVATEPDAETADRPDLSQLRAELNDQFESIRIVERGQYELNLMELYDRDEVIVALQEDGRYSIRVPEAIGGADA